MLSSWLVDRWRPTWNRSITARRSSFAAGAVTDSSPKASWRCTREVTRKKSHLCVMWVVGLKVSKQFGWLCEFRRFAAKGSVTARALLLTALCILASSHTRVNVVRRPSHVLATWSSTEKFELSPVDFPSTRTKRFARGLAWNVPNRRPKWRRKQHQLSSRKSSTSHK